MSTHIPAVRIPPREGVSPWIEVIPAVTPDERLAALEIRRRVFAEEQGVADLRVSDSDDARSLIALATFPPARAGSDERLPVSTGRLTPSLVTGGQALVAWVATVPEARGRGAGALVMRVSSRRRGQCRRPRGGACGAAPCGGLLPASRFFPVGPIYDVRGIPHRRMVRRAPD